MPIYGEAKRRNMSRSVLPSTRRKGARADKRHQHHMVRTRIRNIIARGDWDNEGDLCLDAQRHKPYQGIKVVVQERRDADNIGPIMRWAEANADKMGDTPQERYAKMRSMLPPNLIGWHAMTHIDDIDAYDTSPRRFHYFRRGGLETREEFEAYEKRRNERRFLAHYEALYQVIANGAHGEFNRLLREGWKVGHWHYFWTSKITKENHLCSRCKIGPRYLDGIHDIIPFLNDMFGGYQRENGEYPPRAHGKGFEDAMAYTKDMGWMDKEWLVTW